MKSLSRIHYNTLESTPTYIKIIIQYVLHTLASLESTNITQIVYFTLLFRQPQYHQSVALHLSTTMTYSILRGKERKTIELTEFSILIMPYTFNTVAFIEYHNNKIADIIKLNKYNVHFAALLYTMAFTHYPSCLLKELILQPGDDEHLGLHLISTVNNL